MGVGMGAETGTGLAGAGAGVAACVACAWATKCAADTGAGGGGAMAADCGWVSSAVSDCSRFSVCGSGSSECAAGTTGVLGADCVRSRMGEAGGGVLPSLCCWVEVASTLARPPGTHNSHPFRRRT